VILLGKEVGLDDLQRSLPTSAILRFCDSEICKLAEGAVNPIVYVIGEDIKQYWSQDRPLRDTTHHRLLPGHGAIDHHSLGVVFKPIPYSPNGLPLKSISFQSGDQGVMWDHIKSLAEVQVDDIGWSFLVN